MSQIPQSIWTSAVELQRYLDSCNYQFLFIGGIAYQRWGEPRVTQDLDLTLVTEFGAELPIIEAILKRYQSRVPDPVNLRSSRGFWSCKTSLARLSIYPSAGCHSKQEC